jgi:energy-coupling factor transport system substrate-specific component
MASGARRVDNDRRGNRPEPATVVIGGTRTERGVGRFAAVGRVGSGGGLVVAVASLVGVTAFVYPFLLPVVDRTDDAGAHAADAPLIFAGLTVLCLLAILATLGSQGDGGGTAGSAAGGAASKSVALLGVLVATDATLRLAPSLLGATPIFLLIILVGSVFGPSFGFLMGSLTLLVSAFLTGGVGPWLPFEMLGAGWVGLTAGWLPRPANHRARLLLLAAFGAGWGLLYGAILNLYFWPFAAPGLGVDAGLYWTPGLGAAETFERYAHFYLVTSLGHDLFRAGGNAVLVLVLGGPLLRTLERFRTRFSWQPWEEYEVG